MRRAFLISTCLRCGTNVAPQSIIGIWKGIQVTDDSCGKGPPACPTPIPSTAPKPRYERKELSCWEGSPNEIFEYVVAMGLFDSVAQKQHNNQKPGSGLPRDDSDSSASSGRPYYVTVLQVLATSLALETNKHTNCKNLVHIRMMWGAHYCHRLVIRTKFE